MTTRFESSGDFRKSLEARLRNRARLSKEDIQRLRRKVAFDRFLARVFADNDNGFILKGGYAMELRLSNARATKDIDLTCLSRIREGLENVRDCILADLQRLMHRDLGDFFVFQVGEAKMQDTCKVDWDVANTVLNPGSPGRSAWMQEGISCA